MKFREQLDMVEALRLNMCDLVIANECDCIFSFEYTDEQFEDLCAVAKLVYMESDYIEAHHIASAINNLIDQNGQTIDEVLEMDIYDLSDKAAEYTY